MTGSLTAIAGLITDARVGDHDCDITVSDGTTTVLYTYTLTITNVNDAPTLTVTADGSGAFTEDGSAVDLFSSPDAADGDSQTTQTWKSLIFTVTNVADTTESIVVDGTTMPLTDSHQTANSATNAAQLDVSISGGTATVTVTPDAGSLTALSWRL